MYHSSKHCFIDFQEKLFHIQTKLYISIYLLCISMYIRMAHPTYLLLPHVLNFISHSCEFKFSDLFNITLTSIMPKQKYIILKIAQHFHILDINETRNEAYAMDVTSDTIEISVLASKGAFYAYKTLQSLKEAHGDGINRLPVMTVRDQPRFQYRGLHLDVSRTFHSKPEILRLLEAMSIYKLNMFHFHLTDDEGWRLQIPGLPELTEVMNMLDLWRISLFAVMLIMIPM